MKKLCSMLLILSFFTSCYSTPQVNEVTQVGEGEYVVTINQGYVEIPNEFQYAVNSFVIGIGEASYDVEIVSRGSPIIFYITTPGSQEVDYSLPEVRHFHRGKTVSAIVVPLGVSMLIGFWIWVGTWE